MSGGLYTHEQISQAVRNDPAVAALHSALLGAMQNLQITPAELRSIAMHAAITYEQLRAAPMYPRPPASVPDDSQLVIPEDAPFSLYFMAIVKQDFVPRRPGDPCSLELLVSSTGVPSCSFVDRGVRRDLLPEDVRAVMERLMTREVSITITSGGKE